MRAEQAAMNSRSGLRVLTIASSEVVQDQVAQAVAGWRGVVNEARVGAFRVDAAAMSSLDTVDLLVLEPDLDDAGDRAALTRLRGMVVSGRVGILVTASNITPALMRRLLQEGADDVIAQPCTVAELTDGL